MADKTGQCQCGTVHLAIRDCPASFGARHCEMTRRWSGSSICLRDVDEFGTGHIELCRGLFGYTGGARPSRPDHADCAPEGLAFAGKPARISKAQYEAENPHLNEEV